MDDTKREELEKAYKNYKVRTRMVAVRMVRVLNMSADETASILVHSHVGPRLAAPLRRRRPRRPPGSSPYLNAMEEYWRRGKRVLLVSEYYRTFQDMHRAVLLYYRTARFKLDLLKFTSRKYETLCTNF